LLEVSLAELAEKGLDKGALIWEAWVPALGDSAHGFPLLSGAGRLVIKDAIMHGAALTTMADSAKAYLRRSARLK
jgi:uncharacterized membrane protein YkgB